MSQQRLPNLLLLVLDDVSQRELPSLYGEVWDYGDETPPHVPNLDALAAAGCVAPYVTSSANCSPTRVSLQTGRYPHQFGIGTVISAGNGLVYPPILADSLPELLRGKGYATGMFGKCGFANQDVLAQPLAYGWDTYRAGTHGTNYLQDLADGWTNWTRNDDGVFSVEPEYVTRAQVQAAADWISERSGPWLAQVNLTAPHKPVHVPPASLLTNYAGLSASSSDREKYVAAIEAADACLGPLAAAVELDETLVVVLGDNGTPGDLAHPLQDPAKVKKSLYREGIEVPCIIAGRGSEPVAGVCEEWPTDLPTLVSFLYVAVTGEGKPAGWSSQAGSFAYAEFFEPNGAEPKHRVQVARNLCWKLMRTDGADVLFDLDEDPLEQTPLDPGACPQAYADLSAVIAATE